MAQGPQIQGEDVGVNSETIKKLTGFLVELQWLCEKRGVCLSTDAGSIFVREVGDDPEDDGAEWDSLLSVKDVGPHWITIE